jgi:hypothetical protein
MKPLLTALALTTALTAPEAVLAKQLTFATKIAAYNGPGTYLAYYVTDSSNAYVGTLWMAGSRSRYFEHLSGWYRASGGNMSGIDGITGASVGAGQTLTLTLDLVDTILDGGYTLHIDAAAENVRAVPNEVVIPLTAAGAGQAVAGKAFVTSFTYSQ